jgi:hypothetical protein
MYIAHAREGRFEIVENLGPVDPQERLVGAPSSPAERGSEAARASEPRPRLAWMLTLGARLPLSSSESSVTPVRMARVRLGALFRRTTTA